MTRPLRFLFIFSDTGGGHRAAAQAVRDEMERLYGDAVAVDMADIFVEPRLWPFDRFPAWYRWMVGLDSVPWGIGYTVTDHPTVVETLTRLAWPYVRASLHRFLERHAADGIVLFHSVPGRALFHAVRQGLSSSPMAVVVLDLVGVHAMWFPPGADLYIVPTEAARQRALHWGVPPERLERVGMPVRRAFVEARDLPAAEARARLGLSPERPMALLVGGGEGMGPLEAIVRALARRRPAADLVAIVGRNDRLYERLRRLESPAPLRVERFVSDMHLWMRAADIVVTKAGPNTLSEALVAGVPLVIYSALRGQEWGNVGYVVENGAGLWAPRPAQAARAVGELLADPARRQALAARSRALACPQATERIAHRLVEWLL